jgi:hypothetical protein
VSDQTPEKVVEHHYHPPETGQVVKAFRQYFADNFSAETLREMVDTAVLAQVSSRVADYLKPLEAHRYPGPDTPTKFDKVVAEAVAAVVRGETVCFTSNGYGIANHLRDLVRDELRKRLTDGYEVIVRPRVKEAPVAPTPA